MNSNRPLIVPDSGIPADFDLFATPAGIPVRADKLRSGMILLDPELGTPALLIDHKMRTERNSGEIKFLGHDLDTNRLVEQRLRLSLVLQVMAA